MQSKNKKVNFSLNSELEKYPKLKVNFSLKFNFKIASPRSDNRKKTKVFQIRMIFTKIPSQKVSRKKATQRLLYKKVGLLNVDEIDTLQLKQVWSKTRQIFNYLLFKMLVRKCVLVRVCAQKCVFISTHPSSCFCSKLLISQTHPNGKMTFFSHLFFLVYSWSKLQHQNLFSSF